MHGDRQGHQHWRLADVVEEDELLQQPRRLERLVSLYRQEGRIH